LESATQLAKQPPGNHSLKRAECLKSRKWLDELFESGKRDKAGVFSLSRLEVSAPLAQPVQVAFTVSKRRFKRAHDRNRVKRLMREAYRLNKHLLYQKLESENRKFVFVFVFFGNELPTQEEASNKIKRLLERFDFSKS